MAEDPELTARVRRALDGVPGVVERRMFGSIGFLVDGTLRLAAGSHPDHAVLVRVRPEDRDAALARPGAAPATMGTRTMRGWLFLDGAAVAADDDLARWVALGLAARPRPDDGTLRAARRADGT